LFLQYFDIAGWVFDLSPSPR